jgi:aminomethyltransferase
VWGKESVQFLNGLITNDVAKLEDGGQMAAAFPNAQGRLVALVRVARVGDVFFFETEEVTREKVFQNLFRFTFAGDFFVEDRSAAYGYFELFNMAGLAKALPVLKGGAGEGVFVQAESADEFVSSLKAEGAVEVDEDSYEVLRVEKGVPLYGIDADESTVVPELGAEGLISYSKGCYIGQEVVARIHFRGHVAKELRVVVYENADAAPTAGVELTSPDGKAAGRITSIVRSPEAGVAVGLGMVRYEFLSDGTELMAGGDRVKVVKPAPRF